MTRKDLQLIASVFARTRQHSDPQTWRGLVREMAEELRLRNPGFDLRKFEKACGVDRTEELT